MDENIETIASCAVPAYISARILTSGNARITWDSNVDAVRYQIRFKPEGGEWKNKGSMNSFTNVGNLIAGTTYEVQIRSQCVGGWSKFSESVTFRTK